jgi:hypothetical protein
MGKNRAYESTTGVLESGVAVYPNQINSLATYLIANMEAKNMAIPKIICKLRRPSGFIPLPHLR